MISAMRHIDYVRKQKCAFYKVAINEAGGQKVLFSIANRLLHRNKTSVLLLSTIVGFLAQIKRTLHCR